MNHSHLNELEILLLNLIRIRSPLFWKCNSRSMRWHSSCKKRWAKWLWVNPSLRSKLRYAMCAVQVKDNNN